MLLQGQDALTSLSISIRVLAKIRARIMLVLESAITILHYSYALEIFP